uniref:RRM domain-containing protein n=1 Tax=Guillardia theta TaxID=55529 RepID=A0A7S4L452_GUITH|mmetsp:Transcript_37098/g.116721  ORF Transcript_37098/g.116721 Transcript_37098/m.116721 type:complete len:527 (+) Transcript_37098:150-1730(+)
MIASRRAPSSSERQRNVSELNMIDEMKMDEEQISATSHQDLTPPLSERNYDSVRKSPFLHGESSFQRRSSSPLSELGASRNLSGQGEHAGTPSPQASNGTRSPHTPSSISSPSVLESPRSFDAKELEEFKAFLLEELQTSEQVEVPQTRYRSRVMPEDSLSDSDSNSDQDDEHEQLAHQTTDPYAQAEVRIAHEITLLEKTIREQESSLERLLRVDPLEERMDDEPMEALEERVLSRFPILKRDALIKKYSKYSVPTNVEKHEKHVLPDHFEFSPDMLFRRSIAGHHMHRQEEAKAFGAPAPAHQRSGAFHKDKLVFETPTFQRRISVSELRPDDVKMEERKGKFRPPPLPDPRPPPPPLPDRMALSRASWSRPPFTDDHDPQRARKAFRSVYSADQEHGLPRPPPPPGAKVAPPLPGHRLVAHKLSLTGLPMKCTREDIYEWLEDLREAVATNYNRPDKGFEGGVALFKDPDGWLTGEAVIKFVDKGVTQLMVLSVRHIRNLPGCDGKIQWENARKETSRFEIRG